MRRLQGIPRVLGYLAGLTLSHHRRGRLYLIEGNYKICYYYHTKAIGISASRGNWIPVRGEVQIAFRSSLITYSIHKHI